MSGMAVVLDIEGTVCPISFVHDTLFPYALRRAREEVPRLRFPLDPHASDLERYLADFPVRYKQSAADLLGHIEELVANDVKAPYLKALQGYLWKSGYESGEIQAPVYGDAVEALKRWASQTRVYIYSSGSVPAQKLLFEHTTSGSLVAYLAGYYDAVSAGPKLETASYARIAAATQEQRLVFFSDNPGEIDAAHAAGWETVFVVRPGNPPFPDYHPPGRTATTFAGIDFEQK